LRRGGDARCGFGLWRRRRRGRYLFLDDRLLGFEQRHDQWQDRPIEGGQVGGQRHQPDGDRCIDGQRTERSSDEAAIGSPEQTPRCGAHRTQAVHRLHP
jgi:hypothetical protein